MAAERGILLKGADVLETARKVSFFISLLVRACRPAEFERPRHSFCLVNSVQKEHCSIHGTGILINSTEFCRANG